MGGPMPGDGILREPALSGHVAESCATDERAIDAITLRVGANGAGSRHRLDAESRAHRFVRAIQLSPEHLGAALHKLRALAPLLRLLPFLSRMWRGKRGLDLPSQAAEVRPSLT